MQKLQIFRKSSDLIAAVRRVVSEDEGHCSKLKAEQKRLEDVLLRVTKAVSALHTKLVDVRYTLFLHNVALRCENR